VKKHPLKNAKSPFYQTVGVDGKGTVGYKNGMPKRSRKKPDDLPPTETPADQSAQQERPAAPPQATEKNPNAVALGRLGGLKGGKARAAKLTKQQRSEIAKKAAQARWKKKD
jgi:hypothetical protein